MNLGVGNLVNIAALTDSKYYEATIGSAQSLRNADIGLGDEVLILEITDHQDFGVWLKVRKDGGYLTAEVPLSSVRPTVKPGNRVMLILDLDVTRAAGVRIGDVAEVLALGPGYEMLTVLFSNMSNRLLIPYHCVELVR